MRMYCSQWLSLEQVVCLGWAVNSHDTVANDEPWRAVQDRDFAGYRTACNFSACFIQNGEKKTEEKPMVAGIEGGSWGFTLLCRISGHGWPAREVGGNAVSFVSTNLFAIPK